MATNSPQKNVQKSLTPLWVISLFVSLTEVVLGFAATRTTATIQIILTVFSVTFPLLIAGGFFCILWKKPFAFYPPSEFSAVDVTKYVEAFSGIAGKPVTKTGDLAGKVETFGNPDRFSLLFKASSDFWNRSTKAMEVPGGCVVQVSTRFMSANGEWAIAEALSFVPGVVIANEEGGSGRKLIREISSG